MDQHSTYQYNHINIKCCHHPGISMVYCLTLLPLSHSQFAHKPHVLNDPVSNVIPASIRYLEGAIRCAIALHKTTIGINNKFITGKLQFIVKWYKSFI